MYLYVRLTGGQQEDPRRSCEDKKIKFKFKPTLHVEYHKALPSAHYFSEPGQNLFKNQS